MEPREGSCAWGLLGLVVDGWERKMFHGTVVYIMILIH